MSTARGRPRRVEVRGQEPADVARVVVGAGDEARLAPPQERQADHVQAGGVDDADVVAEPSLAVEHGPVEPRGVGPEAGGPEDRADGAALQVETEWRRRLHPGRREPLRRLEI